MKPTWPHIQHEDTRIYVAHRCPSFAQATDHLIVLEGRSRCRKQIASSCFEGKRLTWDAKRQGAGDKSKKDMSLSRNQTRRYLRYLICDSFFPSYLETMHVCLVRIVRHISIKRQISLRSPWRDTSSGKTQSWRRRFHSKGAPMQSLSDARGCTLVQQKRRTAERRGHPLPLHLVHHKWRSAIFRILNLRLRS